MPRPARAAKLAIVPKQVVEALDAAASAQPDGFDEPGQGGFGPEDGDDGEGEHASSHETASGDPSLTDCVEMIRGDQSATINRNSIETMEGLGWKLALKKKAKAG